MSAIKRWSRRKDCPAQGLVDADINYVGQFFLGHLGHIFPDAVADDDGVIYRVADNGQTVPPPPADQWGYW